MGGPNFCPACDCGYSIEKSREINNGVIGIGNGTIGLGWGGIEAMREREARMRCVDCCATREEHLPRAIAENTLNIMGVDLKVCVLDNGQRVIEAESLKQFFEAMGSTDVQFTEDDAMRLARAIRGIPEPSMDGGAE